MHWDVVELIRAVGYAGVFAIIFAESGLLRGVEIDYCPQCRGVWLDRGEIDKIIERDRLAADDDADRGHRPAYSRPNRRRSLLGDLFDFD